MIFHGKFRTKQGGLRTDSLNLLKRSTVNWNVASDRQLVSVTHTQDYLKNLMFFTPKHHFQKSCNVSMFYVVGYRKQQQQKKKTQKTHPQKTTQTPWDTLNSLATELSIFLFWKTLQHHSEKTRHWKMHSLLYTIFLSNSLALEFTTPQVSSKAVDTARQRHQMLYNINHSPL